MPYRLVGGTRFYQRKEIKDALAYLRLVHNPADNISLTRIINVPPRSIGDKTVPALAAWSAELGVLDGRRAGAGRGRSEQPALPGDTASTLHGKPPQHPFGSGRAARR